MSTWISQSTPILVCFELAFSQIYPFPKYSDITAFIHRTVMTFIAFFLQNRKGTWPLCRSCWTVAIALGHCPMETFPLSGKIGEESWPTSPVLSENYDVSSIHIHKTFNTVFLMWSLSASYLVLCPVSMLPPTTRLTVLCMLHTPSRQNGTRRPGKEVRILQIPQAEKAPPPASVLQGLSRRR